MLSSISNTKVSSILDGSVSEDLNDLLRGLIRKNPTKRFGAEEFKNHKYFKSIDWTAVREKRIEAPFLPREDRINFKPDAYVEEIFGLSKPNEEVEVKEHQQNYSFENWDWTSEDQELPPPNPKLLKKLNKKKIQPPTKKRYRSTPRVYWKTEGGSLRCIFQSCWNSTLKLVYSSLPLLL